MNKVRNWIPLLGMIALLALFFKLPETPALFSIFHCKTCASSDPYLPLLGAAYFSLLTAVSVLFPAMPGPKVSRAGLVWAILLAVAMTYVDWPGWCFDCLVGHACNIAIWTIWMLVPSRESATITTLRERLCLTFFAPISVVALFSCLNLTFMAYGLKMDRNLAITSLHSGDAIPTFSTKTNKGLRITSDDLGRTPAVVLNFIAADCPYCKQQLPVIDSVAIKNSGKTHRFINVSPALTAELIKRSPNSEWVEDHGGKLRELFHVNGYPTMFVLKGNGKIAEVVSGFPDTLKDTLLASLGNAEHHD